MKNIREIYRVFILIFMRDKVNLFFGFFFNAFLMIMLGLFVSDRFNEIGTIGIYDTSNSEFSQQFIYALENEPTVQVKIYTETESMLEDITNGDLVAGVKINPSFELLKNVAPDPLEEGSHILMYGNSGKDFWLKMLEPGLKMGVLKTNINTQTLLNNITIDTEMVQSRNVDYFKFIFPGVLMFSIMGLAFTGALSLLFFRQADVLKRLKITPLKKYEFLAGFTLSYLVLLLMQAVLYIIIAWLVFDYTFTENFLQIGVLVVSCGLLFIILGVAIANLAPTIDSGNNIVRFLNFPASFLCGIFIPIEALPNSLQWLAKVHPLTYFADTMRNTANYSATFLDNKNNYIILGVLFVIFCFVAVRSFKWEEQTK
jgi:ABC-2 type transport system permease protein